MPSISGDVPAVDYVSYFTKQFPKDLAEMAALRDELEKRQGALSAVEDANKLRSEAQKYAEATKADVDGLLADAREKSRLLDAAAVAFDAKASAFEADSARREKDLLAREKEISTREKTVASRMSALEAKAVELESATAKLVAAQTEFDARVKAYQERVAALAP